VSSISTLRGLLPDILEARVASTGTAAQTLWFERLPAVTLIADLSGFTSLAERLASSGPSGVEELSRLVNVWFGSMVDVIVAHGGDIIRFAGDAPIVVFAGDRGSLDERLANAASCGRALQNAIASKVSDTPNMSLRVGIAAGEVTLATVGGIEDRWEFIVGGPPLDEMSKALRSATAGHVVVAPGVRLGADSRGSGEAGPQPLLRSAVLDDRMLRPFVPRAVLRFLDAGQSAWASELRPVSVLFIVVHGIDLSAADGPEELHRTFRALQTTVYESGGSITQLVVDDKGTTLVATWGLPGQTHEDDAMRAVHAASRAQSLSASHGARLGTGIASGRVFCGWRGNDRRHEYAVIGDTVNRAARLCGVSTGDVLCDEPTTRRIGRRARVEPLGPISLKGTHEPAPVFRILEVGGPATSPFGGDGMERVRVVGRATERQLLRESIDALQQGVGGTVVVRGDAGMGKSTLVAEFVKEARGAGILVAVGAGDSVFRAEPYRAWRSVLGAVLDAAPGGRVPDALQDFAPLVADVRGLAAADNAVTAQLTGQARVEKTRDVVVDILRARVSQQPFCLVLEDAHWVDSLSLELAIAIRQRVPQILLVVATRPAGADTVPAPAQLIEQPATRVIDLSRLSVDDVRELMLRRLGVASVPHALVTLVEERAAGYPLFVMELVGALLDAGVVAVAGSACIIPGGETTLIARALPDSVQSAIAYRLDRLTADEQLTVKIAALIGFAFDLSTILAVHPLRPTIDALEATAAVLQARGFVVRNAASASSYSFTHAVVQDVSYGLMVSDQRRRLHRAVAEHLAASFPADPPFGLLAYHWLRAEDDEQSVECLDRAGEVAAAKGALSETARHFQQAVEIVERRPALAADRIRQVRRLRYLGYARSELGDVKGGTQNLQQALGLLGKDPEPSRRALSFQLGREALRQLLSIAGVKRIGLLPPVDREQLVEESEILRLLGKLALFTQDHLAYTATSLRAMNLAERTGARATAASAYAALGYVASTFGLVRLGERWWRLADESGEIDARVNMLAGRMLVLNAATRWDESDRVAEAQERLIASVGYSAMIPTHLTIRQYSHLHQGRLQDALDVASRFLDWALAHNNLQQAFAGHLHFIEINLELGRLDEAERHIREAEALVGRSDPMYVITFRAHCLEARREADDPVGAAQAAATLSALVERTSPIIGGPMNGYVSLADYLIAECGRPGVTQDHQPMRQARAAYGALTKHARFLKYAQPRRWLLAGNLQSVNGSTRGAEHAWERGLELAQRFRMPREAARLHTALGAHARDASERRRFHMDAARAIYIQMGCETRAARL
jgi:class 3 adenylate cyclase